MVFFLDNYTLAPFSYCFMKCEVSPKNDVKTPWEFAYF